MSEPTPEKRDEDLATIRGTYDRYRREDRYRIWDLNNLGFARLIRERDAAICGLLRRNVPASGTRILDLGSGDGRLAAVARDAQVPFDEWMGVDLDPLAVEAAAAAYPFARFLHAPANDIPLETASIDAVVASTLFSSFPSRQLEAAVAAEIVRVIKPGGSLVWYDLRYDNPRNPAVHGITKDRLRQLFPGWAPELRTMTLLPPLARRLGPLTPILYPALHALAPLRSHLIGRLRAPTR